MELFFVVVKGKSSQALLTEGAAERLRSSLSLGAKKAAVIERRPATEEERLTFLNQTLGWQWGPQLGEVPPSPCHGRTPQGVIPETSLLRIKDVSEQYQQSRKGAR